MNYAISTDADLLGPWVAKRGGWDWTPQRGTAIGLKRDGELVAGVVYESHTGPNIWCHIAVERLTRRFLRMIHWYPFVQLGCRRLTALVASDNLRSIDFVTRLGFEHEATLAGAHPGGHLLVFRLLKQDCKWVANEQRFLSQAA